MSRPKSEATLQRERDREIRRERRALLRAEPEARHAKREMKRRVREGIAKNGLPGIKQSGEDFNLQEALAYNPCDGCHRIVGNVEIVNRFCVTCEYREPEYREEVMESEDPTELKAEEDRAVPPEEDGREKKGIALAGQLSLLNIGREC